MQRKYKVIISILSVLVIVMAILLVLSYGKSKDSKIQEEPSIAINEPDGQDLEARLANQEANIQVLEEENNTLTNQVEDLTEQQILWDDELTLLKADLSQAYFMDPAAKEELKYLGIDDPQVITDDLRAHPEVIQMPGVLGGTMTFSDILVLNEKYVYATLSDGHILAYGIYEFRLDDQMDFTWETVLEDTYGSGDSDQYEREALAAYVASGYISYLQKQDHYTLESYSIDSLDLVAFEEDRYIVQLSYYFTVNAEEEPVLNPEVDPIILQDGNFYYAVHYITMIKDGDDYVMAGYDTDYEPVN